PEKKILTITENGYGKKTTVSEYRHTNRGGKGVININCSARNGKVVAVKVAEDDDDIMLISRKGIIIRTRSKGIPTIGRNTQGVRIMRLSVGDCVVSVAPTAGNTD
ncbi:MAG: DNA gyrase C-terminal beta-propeller domain-containing protein, partial [Candidatus Woesearchaeota archaeon]